MKILITALAALLLFIFIACGQNREANRAISEFSLKDMKLESEKPGIAKESITDDFKADTSKPSYQTGKLSIDQKVPPQSQEDWDKKIIKTASLNIEVKDYSKFNSELREKVKQFGGYIAQEEQTQSDYSLENTLIIKVPVDQFDNAVLQLTNAVQKINEKKITSEDVTSEVVDTKSRLEAKKQVRQRYIDLLKQAKNMDEILSIQSEINSIQEEIESAAGRIEYLTHSSSFSTINLTYSQILNASAKNPDQEPSFGTKLSRAFSTGWSWIGELLVGIISVWPLLLMIFAAVIIYRKTRLPKAKQA